MLSRPMLAKAQGFLDAARAELESAPSVAFANAYSAASQAVTALMWSQGLRVADRPREHETVIEYGRAELPATRDLDLAVLDQMRRQRHAIEYEPHRDATAVQARAACAFVGRLLDVIRKRLEAGGA